MIDPSLFIIGGVAAVVGLLIFSFADTLGGYTRTWLASLDVLAKQKNVVVDVRKLAAYAGGAALALSLVAIVFFRPPWYGVSAIVLVAGALAYAGLRRFITMKATKQQKLFGTQLEMALRMMAGSLRVGLGLRQAIVIVTEELEDPARNEFMRVIGRTNIGIGILEAIDEVAERMPSSEMTMSARAIRVQSKTGGDLAKVLDGVADTIRARRGLVAKMKSLTAEGRASGMIILALPLLIGVFIMVTQPAMAHSLFFTKIGLTSLALVVALESLAAFSLNKIMAFDV